jgi:hypothetical protein
MEDHMLKHLAAVTALTIVALAGPSALLPAVAAPSMPPAAVASSHHQLVEPAGVRVSIYIGPRRRLYRRHYGYYPRYYYPEYYAHRYYRPYHSYYYAHRYYPRFYYRSGFFRW